MSPFRFSSSFVFSHSCWPQVSPHVKDFMLSVAYHYLLACFVIFVSIFKGVLTPCILQEGEGLVRKLLNKPGLKLQSREGEV